MVRHSASFPANGPLSLCVDQTSDPATVILTPQLTASAYVNEAVAEHFQRVYHDYNRTKKVPFANEVRKAIQQYQVLISLFMRIYRKTLSGVRPYPLTQRYCNTFAIDLMSSYRFISDSLSTSQELPIALTTCPCPSWLSQHPGSATTSPPHDELPIALL